MTVLRDFINSFDFVRMRPAPDFIQSGVPEKAHAYALAEEGKQYAAYFFSPAGGPMPASLTLRVPVGSYRVEWIDVLTGKPLKRERTKSSGAMTIDAPQGAPEIALRIRRS
jgi:hypothetical protein